MVKKDSDVIRMC